MICLIARDKQNIMKISLFFSIIFQSFLCFSSTETDLNCIVETPSGTIAGKTESFDGKVVRSYLGIPYAEPPIGDLRFKKPIAFRRWNTTLQATALSPACVQYSPNPFPWKADESDLSMDCLFLNIWSPMGASLRSKKTVMFWIHSGGFRIGTSVLDMLNGKVLAAEGDVVVVTINYRLGVEGFYYSGTEDAPGNVGFWDIVEALKWVRKNIRYFGGDENSITLFGQSAGGIAIGMMCVSPITRGLFERVVLQSGAPTNLDGEKDTSFQISQKVAIAVDCADDEITLKRNPVEVVECLRGKDGYTLAVALSNVTADQPRSYYPRYGDDLLPKNTRIAIIEGDYIPVDVLIGSNNGDGATLITKSMKDVFGFFGEKNPQINYTYGESIIRKKFQRFPDQNAVVEQYLRGVKEDHYDEIRFKVFTASGDYSRTCPSNYFAESFAEKNASVFMYFFTHRPSYTPWASWMLAVHHDETPFVFGYPLRYPHLYSTDELELSKRMIHAWSTFAKTGVPEYGSWPQYSKRNPLYREINIGNTMNRHLGPHQKSCNFFRPYFGF